MSEFDHLIIFCFGYQYPYLRLPSQIDMDL